MVHIQIGKITAVFESLTALLLFVEGVHYETLLRVLCGKEVTIL